MGGAEPLWTAGVIALAAHAGDRTVHPIHADSAAMAVVVPVEIAITTSRGRHGIEVSSDVFTTRIVSFVWCCPWGLPSEPIRRLFPR